MGVFDRAGNILKGLLRKPLQALEKSPEERMLERELQDKAALERARANIEELDERARASPPPSARATGKPAPVAASAKDPGADGDSRKKRRMGPDD